MGKVTLTDRAIEYKKMQQKVQAAMELVRSLAIEAEQKRYFNMRYKLSAAVGEISKLDLNWK